MDQSGKYVVLFNDRVYGGALGPEAPSTENTARNLKEAKQIFLSMARDAGCEDIPTDEGGPFADLDFAASWDGISYGDYHLYRLTIGKRGGVIVEKW
jgi:hypothetical protein